MNKTNFSNNLKRLLNISLLLNLTLMWNSNNIYAGSTASKPVEKSKSLKDYLSNENNTLKFNTNSIENNGSDMTSNINSGDFIIDSGNNITYIDTNTIPLLNNTGGGK